MNNNISNIKDCYGCGVCASACPHKIISLHLNIDGFYEPFITELDSCTNCGLCQSVCAFINKDILPKNSNFHSWAAWSNDNEVRLMSSSGGVAYEIAIYLFNLGYKGIGCRYNSEKNRAEHFIANNIEEYKPSIGSKYIQSFTEDAFKRIDRNEKYFIVGTPCQIASLRRYVKRFRCEERFVLIDFYCHSVPSMMLWQSYTSILQRKIGHIKSVHWRTKRDIDGTFLGWGNSYNISAYGNNGQLSSNNRNNDLFFRYFLGDYCSGSQCHRNCRFKYDKSFADIRIGDLWGKLYKDYDQGVSALIALTEKGNSIIGNLTSVTLVEHPFSVVASGQMKKPSKSKLIRPIVLFCLRKGIELDNPFLISLITIQSYFDRIKKKINSIL